MRGRAREKPEGYSAQLRPEFYRRPLTSPEPQRYMPRYETSLPTPNRANQENYRDTRTARRDDKRQNDTGTVNAFCRYCKRAGHTIEECRRKRYNDSQKELPGNGQGPSGRQDATPTDEQRQSRPLSTIDIDKERSPRESDHEQKSLI
ncbi:hypothetical protein ALC60_07247 [Trachymyrmex zeteki]|uniref:CCHC-type domain-containing protein n=1 Tax=Mycetomoellerius zeteki TaxID=64791 RepID=A0A151X0D0_9HYME|nr:hypothetical protein ALC60_07247 [Trachymyrmex zeteki]